VTDRQALFYVGLLVKVGCHTDSHQARWFGDDLALKTTKFAPTSAKAGGWWAEGLLMDMRRTGCPSG
jgi:hypothetical protein